MQSYDYLAVPAPAKGQKIKGLKTPAERYAHQLTMLLNELAAEGWEYWRSDCLPSEERKGLTGTAIVQNNLLIFRRPSAETLAENPVVEAPAQPQPVGPTLRAPQAPLHPQTETRREPVFRDRPPRDDNPEDSR